MDVLLKDVNMVGSFVNGGLDLVEYVGRFGLKLAEEMFDSHRVGVALVVV